MGNLLVKLRKEKGWTQEELANKLVVTTKSVSRWESGNGIPSIDTCVKLADLFEITIEELIEGKRKIKKQSTREIGKSSDYINGVNTIIPLIFMSLGVAMGVGIVVLNTLNLLTITNAITMLGLGLTGISIGVLTEKNGSR